MGHVAANRYIVASGQVLTPAGRQIDLPGIRPQALALSPDGSFVVTAGQDSTLRVCDPGSGRTVLLGTRSYLPRVIAGAEIDAQVGRQGHEGLRRIRELKTESKLADVVVLHLGTNGYLQESQVRDMLTELGDRQRVIVVNVHAARRWASINNALLQRETSLTRGIIRAHGGDIWVESDGLPGKGTQFTFNIP